MVRHCSCASGHGFHHIKPVRICRRRFHRAARREITRVTHVPRTASKKIRIQRNDHIRLVELVNRIDRPAEGKSRSLTHVVAATLLVLMPLRLWKFLENGLNLWHQRRGGNRFSQNAESCTSW